MNLRGKVSIYKHDEFDENGEPIEIAKQVSIAQGDVEKMLADENNKMTKSELIRAQLGNYITSLGRQKIHFKDRVT